MVFGDGIDIPVHLLTDFRNRFNNSSQNNFRYTAGINFNLGGQSK